MFRLGLITFLLLAASNAQERVIVFEEPIDAISFGVETTNIDLAVRSGKSEWHTLEVETEFDPMLRETNLVMLPEPTNRITVRGSTRSFTPHPIRISNDPIRVELAATNSYIKPRILTRRQWGADESLLYTSDETTRSDINTEQGNGTIPERVKKCDSDRQTYAHQFRTNRTVTQDNRGRKYRWPQRYSPDIKLLVVHHTAQKITGDPRTPVERMRALYEYHAKSRGWGDIGYNYIIDERGQIYEGRAGGNNVVGGHAYCSNVGTLGVALMGNFDEEKPTQNQIKSLQWLLEDLAKRYDINLKRNVSWRGKSISPIIRHRDIVQTLCPGYYIANTTAQIRRNVIAGNTDTAVVFPTLVSGYRDKTAERRRSRLPTGLSTLVAQAGLSAIGSTTITGRPGGEATLNLTYRAGSKPMQRRARIGSAVRSNLRIGLWQEIKGRRLRVRRDLLLPDSLRARESTNVRVHVQMPRTAGSYTLDIGPVTYLLKVEGRRMRSSTRNPVRQSFNTVDRRNVATPGSRRQRVYKPNTVSSSTPLITPATDEKLIRIRLSYPHSVATITTAAGEVHLGREGRNCVSISNQSLRSNNGIVRINTSKDIATIKSWSTLTNRFRGVIECRIIDGEFVLINELSLEQYLMGLGEEPDTEPFEKQKAFAIAARSYAAHYMDSRNRKFPGKPYDGDDSPAHFQKYSGVAFENNNPDWLRAVRDTTGKVIMKNGDIIKAAYYSSNDGRTRSPKENGWNSFPYAEVFASKSDPWCKGMTLRGHGVGMSGCGAKGQAQQGKTAEQILRYYYTGASINPL